MFLRWAAFSCAIRPSEHASERASGRKIQDLLHTSEGKKEKKKGQGWIHISFSVLLVQLHERAGDKFTEDSLIVVLQGFQHMLEA